MAYIGKTPSQATRSRFYYTATGGETSLSGADDNGNTLVFSDGNYVDVMLNGVNLVADTDYNTTTANTIGGLTALTASDIVEIVVYDTFSVFGGNVKGDFNVQNGTLTAETVTASGLVTAQDGLVVDNDGATVATFDRATSDGTIVDLQKGGSSVGSIGTLSGFLGIGNDDAGFLMAGGVDAIAPWNSSTNATRDNAINLGTSTNRWKDLYLSGGVFLGGTGSANKLDDYEEGTWTPILGRGATQPSLSYANQAGTYIKIGKMVFVTGTLQVTGITSQGSGGNQFRGLPYTPVSSNVGQPTLLVNYNTVLSSTDSRAAWYYQGGFTFSPNSRTNGEINENFSTGYLSFTGCYPVA